MIVGVFVVEFLVKASESGPSAGSSSTHWGFSNLSHIKKALCSACTHCSMSPQSRGVNRCSCSHPQNARLPISLSSVGMTTSCSTTSHHLLAGFGALGLARPCGWKGERPRLRQVCHWCTGGGRAKSFLPVCQHLEAKALKRRYTGSRAFLDCTALKRLAKMPGKHKWRGVYAEENAFAICPDVRWPPWLHMIPDMGYTSGLG